MDANFPEFNWIPLSKENKMEQYSHDHDQELSHNHRYSQDQSYHEHLRADIEKYDAGFNRIRDVIIVVGFKLAMYAVFFLLRPLIWTDGKDAV